MNKRFCEFVWPDTKDLGAATTITRLSLKHDLINRQRQQRKRQ